MQFRDIWGKIQPPSSEEDFPYQEFSKRILRTFGILCFVCAGCSGILLAALGLNAVHSLKKIPTISSIMVSILVVLLALGAIALFVVLGLRLCRNKSKHGEDIAIGNVALVCISFIAMMLLYGVSWVHVIYLIELVFLGVVTVYMDPELAQERKLSRHARTLPPEERREYEKKIDNRRPAKGYITLNFFNLFWIFVVCCFLGLVIETIYHIVMAGWYQDRAGLLYGPFSPIYGFGGLMMTIALNRFHDKPILVIFLVSAVIGGCFEFFVSWIMQYAFGIVAWDYTGTFGSIDGRTNFMYMCFWGLLGLLWVKLLLPILLWLINKIPWRARYSLTTICTVFMFVDLIMTVQTIDCWFLRESGHAPDTALEEFMAVHYDNEYMKERFQTMDLNPDQASRI